MGIKNKVDKLLIAPIAVIAAFPPYVINARFKNTEATLAPIVDKNEVNPTLTISLISSNFGMKFFFVIDNILFFSYRKKVGLKI
ncbi:MAG: hypothetical protein N4A68_11420 [Maledivibacter sp.]|jgi:hypothetical protein|nr:hypothetical protein [Maledivibacter sp.]